MGFYFVKIHEYEDNISNQLIFPSDLVYMSISSRLLRLNKNTDHQYLIKNIYHIL